MRILFCCLLALPVYIGATDLSPWTGVDLELHPRITGILEKYPSHTNYIMGVGLEASYDVWQADFEVNIARTQKRDLSLDDIRFTGRYRWTNDIVGDPYTLVTGFTFITTTQQALDDPNLFHNGRFEAEFHAAIGKESDYGDVWTTRYWGVGTLGVADRGFPWLRGVAAWEKNWCDNYVLGLFVNVLWGFGTKSFHEHDFHGYGSIHHQSMDVGANYRVLWVSNSVVTFGYSYRIFANNFPKHVNTFVVNLMVPFGI